MSTEAPLELSLLHAVLERAVLDAVGSTMEMKCKVAMKEAREWLFEWWPSDERDAFSFPWICAHLNVCPRRVASNVRKFIDEGARIHHTRQRNVGCIQGIVTERDTIGELLAKM